MSFHSMTFLVALASCLSQPGLVAAADTFFAVDADPFLGRDVASRDSVHSAIKVALRSNCSSVEARERLAEAQGQLRPIFDSLPQNHRGRLEGRWVRYLLYRHFLHQRAWIMRGLGPDDGAAGRQPFKTVLQAPEEVWAVVQHRLAGYGLTLGDVATLAILLENKVHEEAVGRLEAVWKAHGLGAEDTLGWDATTSVVEVHMLTYLMPDLWAEMRLGHTDAEKVGAARREIVELYPTWSRTQRFLQRSVEDATQKVKGPGFAVGFRDAKRVVQEVVEHFGRWQDKECHELKQKLLTLESSRPGRVELKTLYSAAIKDERWLLDESLPYLRKLGAIDDSDSQGPSIVVPNYVSSAANNLGGSGDFDLACRDECQDLLGHIERRIGAPRASVEEIAGVVGTLASDWQGAPGVVEGALRKKLEEVAEAHGGAVQLHGRLFALWLHHAYPRDCPYPHLAGSTEQLQPEEFEARTHSPASASREDMLQFIRSYPPAEQEGPEAASTTPLPWDTLEERLEPTTAQSHVPVAALLPLVAALAAAPALLILVAAMNSRRRTLRNGQVSKGPLLDVGEAQVAAAPGAQQHRCAEQATAAQPGGMFLVVDAGSAS